MLIPLPLHTFLEPSRHSVESARRATTSTCSDFAWRKFGRIGNANIASFNTKERANVEAASI